MLTNITRWSGPLTALIAAALFGISTPLSKVLLGSGVDPWLMAGLLYCGSGVGLSVVYAIRGSHTREATLRRADLPLLTLITGFGGVAAPVLLMIGLTRTSAASASLLLNVEGLATMAIAWLVFRESVDRRLLVGALSILAGALLISYQGSGAFGAGSVWIIAACLGWGIDNNLTRKLSGQDPVQIAAIKGVIAGTVNIGIALALGAHWPAIVASVEAASVGFVGYGVSIVAFVLALRKLGAARTSAYFSIAPFVGAVASVVLLGESFTPLLILGALLMMVGVYLHLTERHEHDHAHAPLEHEHLHVHDQHHQHEHAAGESVVEPHSHWHQHTALRHRHAHFPDIHHRHDHGSNEQL